MLTTGLLNHRRHHARPDPFPFALRLLNPLKNPPPRAFLGAEPNAVKAGAVAQIIFIVQCLSSVQISSTPDGRSLLDRRR